MTGLRRLAKRCAIAIAGSALLLVGLVMLVAPGPGLVVIVAGLAVLATEFAWAERHLAATRRRCDAARHVARQRLRTRSTTVAGGPR